MQLIEEDPVFIDLIAGLNRYCHHCPYPPYSYDPYPRHLNPHHPYHPCSSCHYHLQSPCLSTMTVQQQSSTFNVAIARSNIDRNEKTAFGTLLDAILGAALAFKEGLGDETGMSSPTGDATEFGALQTNLLFDPHPENTKEKR